MKLTDITNLYVGQSPVSEVYLGNTLVWPPVPVTGCSPEGGVMSVADLVDGGTYVIYGCGYIGYATSGISFVYGDECEAEISGDSISFTCQKEPLYLLVRKSGDTFYAKAIHNNRLEELRYTPDQGNIFVSTRESFQPISTFSITNGFVGMTEAQSGKFLYFQNINNNWLRTGTEMTTPLPQHFQSWAKLYRTTIPPSTGVTFVNSIYPQGTYVQNRIYLPFQTQIGIEMFYEGEILANVGGICFGGLHQADTNDFRFFDNGIAYFDCGNQRIRLSGVSRGDIRKVHTYNYGFDLTLADESVRSVAGTMQETAPVLDGLIEIGRMKIKSFKVTLGNQTLFDGVPAVRLSDGYVGLYDNVSGQFCLPENQDYLTYD